MSHSKLTQTTRKMRNRKKEGWHSVKGISNEAVSQAASVNVVGVAVNAVVVEVVRKQVRG